MEKAPIGNVSTPENFTGVQQHNSLTEAIPERAGRERIHF